MTTIIKNGTIVTADLTYKADVAVEGGRITEIGENLSGGDQLIRSRQACFRVIPKSEPTIILKVLHLAPSFKSESQLVRKAETRRRCSACANASR